MAKRHLGLSNEGSENLRYLSLGTKNKVETNPVWRRWLREKPLRFDDGLHEERDGHYYENFTHFTGYLSVIKVVEKEITFNGKRQASKRLIVIFDTDEYKYEIEVGSYTSRYSMSMLSRMCNPKWDASKLTTIMPYHINDNGKSNIGISVYQYEDDKDPSSQNQVLIPQLKKEESIVLGLPGPEVIETDTGVMWIWSKRATASINIVKDKLAEAWSKESPIGLLVSDDDSIDKEDVPTTDFSPQKTTQPQIENVDNDLPF